jgi:hypothetical protein
MNPLQRVNQRDYTRKFLLMVGCLAVWGCGLAMSRGAMTLVFVDASGKETTLVAGTNKLPSLLGNIRADGAPSLTQSVLFKINGESGVENVPPYYAKGDIQNVPKMHQFQARSYVVSAAAYRYDNAKGANLGGTSVSFTLALGTVDPPPPPPPPPPGPDPTPTGNALGDFALQPGSDDVLPANSSRRISEAQLRYAGIDGVTIRARPHWDYIPFYKSCLDRCVKTGDKATLLLMGGVTATPWAESNLTAYEAAAAKMGVAFSQHPNVVGIHVTGCSPSGVSEELHWKPGDNRAYIAANKRLIDAWAKAFPKQTILLAIGGGDPAGMTEIINYGVPKYGSRLLIKHNSMKASTTLTAAHNVLVVNAGKKGASIGWEMVGSTKEARFGGTYDQMYSNVNTLTTQAGKAIGQRYLAHYPPDLEKLR